MILCTKIAIPPRHFVYCMKLRIWSHLLKKSLMENFTFVKFRYYNVKFDLRSIINIILLGVEASMELLNCFPQKQPLEMFFKTSCS